MPASGPGTNNGTGGGATIDLVDIQSFLDQPPPNLIISAVKQTTVGGLVATRFDVQVSNDATCAQNQPCEYVFETPTGWATTAAIHAESAHRIWWIPDHPTGAAMILAVDRDAAFLDRATELVKSIEPLP